MLDSKLIQVAHYRVSKLRAGDRFEFHGKWLTVDSAESSPCHTVIRANRGAFTRTFLNSLILRVKR